MDAVMAERVNKLARSLKDLHLAASYDEAQKRAEEILFGTAQPQSASSDQEKTLGELMGEQAVQPQAQPVKEAGVQVEEIIIEAKEEQPPSSKPDAPV